MNAALFALGMGYTLHSRTGIQRQASGSQWKLIQRRAPPRGTWAPVVASLSLLPGLLELPKVLPKDLARGGLGDHVYELDLLSMVAFRLE